MKLIIKSKIKERDFIEGVLNMKYSGVSENYILLLVSFHAMDNRWKIDKLIYYLNLLEISQKIPKAKSK